MLECSVGRGLPALFQQHRNLLEGLAVVARMRPEPAEVLRRPTAGAWPLTLLDEGVVAHDEDAQCSRLVGQQKEGCQGDPLADDQRVKAGAAACQTQERGISSFVKSSGAVSPR